MKTKFNETSIPQSYSVDAESRLNLMLAEAHVENMFKCTFTSIAKFLSIHKHTANDDKVAFVITSMKNEFKAAAIVQHVTGGDETEDSGNFNLTFTLDKADVDDIEEKYNVFDPAFTTLMGDTARSDFKFSFISPTFIVGAVNLVFDNILKFLDTNTGEEGVDLELDGYFIASGAIEDGVKVFAIVPGDHIKTIIKDDAALNS